MLRFFKKKWYLRELKDFNEFLRDIEKTTTFYIKTHYNHEIVYNNLEFNIDKTTEGRFGKKIKVRELFDDVNYTHVCKDGVKYHESMFKPKYY